MSFSFSYNVEQCLSLFRLIITNKIRTVSIFMLATVRNAEEK